MLDYREVLLERRVSHVAWLWENWFYHATPRTHAHTRLGVCSWLNAIPHSGTLQILSGKGLLMDPHLASEVKTLNNTSSHLICFCLGWIGLQKETALSTRPAVSRAREDLMETNC